MVPPSPLPSTPAPLAAPLPPPREPGTPYRVCLVCLGNICRSPMAETVLRAALAESVWHTGCTSWYVDENGNDPNQWPWLWSRYRRRTARIEPGAYELTRAASAPAVAA